MEEQCKSVEQINNNAPADAPQGDQHSCNETADQKVMHVPEVPWNFSRAALSNL